MKRIATLAAFAAALCLAIPAFAANPLTKNVISTKDAGAAQTARNFDPLPPKDAATKEKRTVEIADYGLQKNQDLVNNTGNLLGKDLGRGSAQTISIGDTTPAGTALVMTNKAYEGGQVSVKGAALKLEIKRDTVASPTEPDGSAFPRYPRGA